MNGACLSNRHGTMRRGRSHGGPEPLIVDGDRAVGPGLKAGPKAGHAAGPEAAGEPATATAQQAEHKAQGQHDPDYFQEIFHNGK